MVTFVLFRIRIDVADNEGITGGLPKLLAERVKRGDLENDPEEDERKQFNVEKSYHTETQGMGKYLFSF